MFYLHSQIHYGGAVSFSFVKSILKLGKIQKDEYQGLQSFFSVAGTYKNCFMGGQIFANKALFSMTTYTPSWSFGAKGLLGYNFDDFALLYLGCGFKNDEGFKNSETNSKKFLLSLDADLFVAKGIGLGISFSSNHLFSLSQFFAQKDIRVLVKIIFRYL